MRNPNDVTITFQTGKTTCAYDPKKFCKFVSTKSCGTQYICGLFEQKLHDKEGWLQRCPECLRLDNDTTS